MSDEVQPSARWKRATLWLLGLAALTALAQDLTGSLFGKSVVLKLLKPGESNPDYLRLRTTVDAPDDLQLRRQVRVYEDGRRLRGPHNFVSQLADAQPGSFVIIGNTVIVRPFAATGTCRAWFPKPVPVWLRWPLYLAAGVLLLWPRTWRYYHAQPSTGGRMAHLDAVRGLACLLVVGTHFSGIFYPDIGSSSAFAWYEPQWWHRWLPFAGLVNAAEFAVDVFFILSGFVLYLPFCCARNWPRLSGAAVKRPLRLYGLVIAVMFICYLLHLGGWYFGSYFVPAKTWAGFANDVIHAWDSSLSYNAAFWTIRYELLGSWAIFAFTAIFNSSPWRWLGYAVLLVATRTSGYVDFVFGAVLADVWKSCPGLVQSRHWRFLAPALLVLGLFLGGYSSIIEDKEGLGFWLGKVLPNAYILFGGGYGLIGAVMVIIGVLLWSRAQSVLGHGALVFIGRLSFAIYAIHGPLVNSLACWVYVRLRPSQVDAKFVFDPDGMMTHHTCVLLVLLVYLVVLFAMSAVLTAFVDEPCIKLSKRLGSWTERRVQKLWGCAGGAGASPTARAQDARLRKGYLNVAMPGPTPSAEFFPAAEPPPPAELLRDALRDTWEARWSDDAYVPFWETRGDAPPVRQAVADGWLRPGMKVMEIGCGRGEISAWLAGQGFEVVGVDVSSRVIERALGLHEGVPGLKFLPVDVCGPDPQIGPFDAVVDRGCLHVIDGELQAAYARNVLAWSRIGTRFLLLMHCYGPHTQEVRTAQVKALFVPGFELQSVDPFDIAASHATEPIPACAFRLERR